MPKAFKHSCSIVLVLSLVFSSVGYSVTSFACPTMKREATSACSMCKDVSADEANSCCQPKAEHKVVKAEYEKPHELKTLTHQVFVAITLTATFDTGLITAASVTMTGLPAAFVHSVEKCALLSTFLI